MIKGLAFAKGHGTGNDFVIIEDPYGELHVGPDEVAAICDRRRGIGGDGLLRVIRTEALEEAAQYVGQADWFMDYRNADGSLAQMCGNGARVFARYLEQTGLVTETRIAIATRAGLVVADLTDDHSIGVDMPLPSVRGRSSVYLAGSQPSGVDLAGVVAYCGNPNLVCYVEDPGALDLTGSLVLNSDDFPDGANVEFIAVDGDDRVWMRVVERGVGETLSCGSGACAVAAVVLRDSGRDKGELVVEVPGGQLRVSLGPHGCVLRGPAVIVANGVFG